MRKLITRTCWERVDILCYNLLRSCPKSPSKYLRGNPPPPFSKTLVPTLQRTLGRGHALNALAGLNYCLSGSPLLPFHTTRNLQSRPSLDLFYILKDFLLYGKLKLVFDSRIVYPRWIHCTLFPFLPSQCCHCHCIQSSGQTSQL